MLDHDDPGHRDPGASALVLISVVSMLVIIGFVYSVVAR